MTYLSKYGVARKIRIPMVKRGVVDHAVSADWTPAAGDVKISKDGGVTANVTNLPTAIAMGNSAIWEFSLTATEMQCAQASITTADSATKAVEDTFFDIETYGNASAQHAVDLSDSVRAGLTALPNATVSTVGGLPVAVDTSGRVDVLKVNGTSQTAGDINARLGAPAGASMSADIAAVKVDTGATRTAVGTAGAGLTALGDTRIANLDVAVSTRLASASYTAPDNASINSIGVITTAIKAKTDNLPASPAATSDIPTANANADALLDRAAGVETGWTVRQGLRIMLSAMAGKASGLDTNAPKYRDMADSKDRISATTDANGNRTAVTRDAS